MLSFDPVTYTLRLPGRGVVIIAITKNLLMEFEEFRLEAYASI
jgi:hypothetical protein